MKTLLILTVLISFSRSFATEGWFCTEESSEVRENEVHSCGMAYNKTEDEARDVALEAAIHEFNMICKWSASCKGRKFDTIPTRTDCSPFKLGYRCYRMVKFVLLPKE